MLTFLMRLGHLARRISCHTRVKVDARVQIPKFPMSNCCNEKLEKSSMKDIEVNIPLSINEIVI